MPRVRKAATTYAEARLRHELAKWSPIIRPDNPVEARRHLELAIEEVRAELRRLDIIG
jgi:hypothetical protein